MIVLRGHIDQSSSRWSVDDMAYTMPVGSGSLAALITADPPRPDELTNAIGLFVDHLDDVTREVPAAALADRVELFGPGLHTFACVEVGDAATLPFDLPREAAEEVFRTLATEADRERALNPGLPHAEHRSILGVSCAVVATMRALDISAVVVMPEVSV